MLEEKVKVDSFSEEKRAALPLKLKYLTAAAIFYGNITFGCAFNTYGPALTSLEHKYETDSSTISRVFTIVTACTMIGALLSSFLFNWINRQLAVIVVLAMMAAMMIATPLCPTMTLFFLTTAVMGLCGGAYGTAQFVWILEMMQKDCPPYVQAQHFFYAVGTSLAGFIMAPFLDEDDGEIDKKLFIPYTIVGVMIGVASCAHILLFIFMRYYPPPPEEEEEVIAATVSEETHLQYRSSAATCSSEQSTATIIPQKSKTSSSRIWPWPKIRIVLLTCCIYGAYQGMEICTFQFFPKFGQNSDLNLSESKSTYVLTGMTAAYAAGRVLAIVAVLKVPNQLILCVNIALMIIANVLLVGWANNSLTVLWTCSIIFGLGFSSFYPSISAYIERYLNITNFIGSLMLVSGSGVGAIYPVVVGNSIEHNPIVLSYTAFFSIGLIVFSFGILSYITQKDKTRHV